MWVVASGFFVIRTHFGKYLVIGDAHGDGHPHLPPHPFANGIRQLNRRKAVVFGCAGHIQIGLVDGGRLQIIGVFVVDPVDLRGDLCIQLMPGRHKHDAWAFPLRLPDGVGGFDAGLLGQLVFGHHHAVAVLGIAGHGHGHQLQLGPLKAFAGGKEIVAVAMKDQPLLHMMSLLWADIRNKNVCSCYIIENIHPIGKPSGPKTGAADRLRTFLPHLTKQGAVL